MVERPSRLGDCCLISRTAFASQQILDFEFEILDLRYEIYGCFFPSGPGGFRKLNWITPIGNRITLCIK